MKLRRKNTYFLEWGSNPWKYIFKAEIFRSFLVQMKTAKSPFEINWPLIKSQFHHIWSGCQSKAFKYLRRRHIILNSQLQSLQPSLFSEYWSENWQHAIMWRSTHEQRQVKLLWLFHFFRYQRYGNTGSGVFKRGVQN